MNTLGAIKQLMLQSGGTWILWLLGVLSLLSIAIAVERWSFFRSRSANLHALSLKLDHHLASRDFEGAIHELGQSRSVAAAIAAAGLRLAERGPAAVEKAMQSAAALERSRLEQGLTYLGTVGNNAPFIGLFGTVIGIIGAFEELGHGGSTQASAVTQVASQAVMSSIAEALVATAAGILVALPAVAAFNYFQRQIASLLAGTEVLSNLVLAYLVDRERHSVGGGG